MQRPGVLEPGGQLLQLHERQLPREPPQLEPDVQAEDPGHQRNQSTLDHRQCQEVCNHRLFE